MPMLGLSLVTGSRFHFDFQNQGLYQQVLPRVTTGLLLPEYLSYENDKFQTEYNSPLHLLCNDFKTRAIFFSIPLGRLPCII